MSDDKIDITPTATLSLDELTDALNKRKLVEQNDMLVLRELRSLLTRQQEQALVIDDLRGIVRTLSAGMVATIDEVQTLRHALTLLEQQYQDVAARTDEIAKLCQTLAKHVASLRDSVEDITEP